MKQDFVNSAPAPREVEVPDRSEPGVKTLISNMTAEASHWIKQETQLAKAEISEKIADAGKNVTCMAAGGFTIYVGIVIFLMALSGLLGIAFHATGLSLFAATICGLITVGIIAISTGLLMCRHAKNQLSLGKVKPSNTTETAENSSDWS